MTTWPRQRECDAFYGNPRNPKDPTRGNRQWEQQNLTLIKVPFVMTYDGQPISGLRVHRKCAEAFRAAFDDMWQASGRDQKALDRLGASITGGAYCFRTMRGGTSLSMHAYGCAVDLDPARNSLGDRTPAFERNGIVVQAFLKVGAVWGGDWNGNGLTSDEPRCDGMHFQFARLS